MVLLKCIIFLILCSNCTIDYLKRSNSRHAWDFNEANQLEIKLNKNLTQAFCFGLKFWTCLTENQCNFEFSSKKLIFR